MVPGGGLARVSVEIEENGAKDCEKDAPRMLRVARRGDDFFDGHVVFAIAVDNIVNVHMSVQTYSKEFEEKLKRKNFATPKNYLGLLKTYQLSL